MHPPLQAACAHLAGPSDPFTPSSADSKSPSPAEAMMRSRYRARAECAAGASSIASSSRSRAQLHWRRCSACFAAARICVCVGVAGVGRWCGRGRGVLGVGVRECSGILWNAARAAVGHRCSAVLVRQCSNLFDAFGLISVHPRGQ